MVEASVCVNKDTQDRCQRVNNSASGGVLLVYDKYSMLCCSPLSKGLPPPPPLQPSQVCLSANNNCGLWLPRNRMAH